LIIYIILKDYSKMTTAEKFKFFAACLQTDPREKNTFSHIGDIPLKHNAADGPFSTRSRGFAKRVSCKACDFMRNEAYFSYAAMTND
jgi:hypothetical protein